MVIGKPICIHVNSYDKGVWDAFVNDPTQIIMTNNNGFITPKPKVQWYDNYHKKLGYDLKPKSILISALDVDEYYCVSHCEIAKSM